MSRRVMLIVAALLVTAASAWAQPPEPGRGRGAGGGQAPGVGRGQANASPAALVGQVERGCFTCHDIASNVKNGPNRQALWNMTPEKLRSTPRRRNAPRRS